MKFTEYFLKTSKTVPSDAQAESHRLLYRGGFIRQVATGRYAFMPLGYRVKDKIIKIIVEEMEAIGSQRMELPIMQPIEPWRITNRDEAFGEQMIVAKDHFGRTFAMSATAEALMTEVIKSEKPSYKDLPINVYQFLPKFRDELRPRGGLIRVREFLMKDAYNYERDEKSFMKTYDAYWKAYEKIFNRVGLKTEAVIADNGALGGDYSHEFMVITPERVQELDLYFDEDEKELRMEVEDVSKNQKEYKKILKFYAQHPEKTLKNMVYVVDGKKYICITIRGDYRIDFIKLRRLLKYKTIRPATKSEIDELGSFIGYVSPIGLDSKVELIIDESVKYNKNYYDGAHKERVFRKNVNIGRDLKVKDFVDVREDKVFSAGGDKIVMCDRCGYKANVEKAEFVRDSVNIDEEEKPFEIIEQPEWVCTMDENVEHYKKPKSHFLKNVVFKDKKGRLIIAVVRGDLEANATKIANLFDDIDVLDYADEEDLTSIGTKSGWVHSWGHDEGRDNVIYVGDIALKMSKNLIGGLKEKTTDSFNVNYGRDFKVSKIDDIASAYDGAKCPKCKDGYLKEKKSIEVGHIFKYDHYYTNPHKAYFVDKDGKEKPMWMGAYGIGVGRAMASVVEMHHDENGIVWPRSIAPFSVILVSIGDGKKITKESEKLYNDLSESGVEILWDDRSDVSPGVKFADADLIGIPLRIVISEKTLKEDKVEMKKRDKDNVEFVDMDKAKILKYL
ncbi:hypothetical protein JW710_02235 [Candidatus Dojkabacteria bacterium]|nr:hypothetical protein [Candidatus Dojkabacteria bacterium]